MVCVSMCSISQYWTEFILINWSTELWKGTGGHICIFAVHLRAAHCMKWILHEANT